MNNSEFEELIHAAPQFSANRNYWLIRTQGGLYYDHFKTGNFIAIGFNEINLFEISEAHQDPKRAIKILTELAKKKLPENTKPGYAASQMSKFTYEIKKGDIVIIPNESSHRISIGEVLENSVELIYNPTRPKNMSEEEAVCPYIKRKKVRWLKEVNRYMLDPVLFRLLFSHHIITEGNDYANSIDNLLHDFYIKGDEAYLILNVTTNDDIKARTLFQMGHSLLEIVDEFCEYHNLGIDTSDVEVKLALQSPGKIQLSAKTKAIALITGIVVVGIVGGGFKVHWGGFSIDLSTDGAIQKVTEFLDHRQQRETKQQLLDKHLKSLQIREPDDLIKLIKATTYEDKGEKRDIDNTLPTKNEIGNSNVNNDTDSTEVQ